MRKCKQKFAWLLSLIMFFSVFSPSYARSIGGQLDDSIPLGMLAVTEQTTSAQLTTTGSALTLDKTELELWINKAQDIDTDLYTEDSVKILEEALEKALALNDSQYVLEEDKITQEAIDGAVLDLQQAIDNLIQKDMRRAILSIERTTLGQPFYMDQELLSLQKGKM